MIFHADPLNNLFKPFSHEVKVDCNDLKGKLVLDFFSMYNTILSRDHSPTLYPWKTLPFKKNRPGRLVSVDPES